MPAKLRMLKPRLQELAPRLKTVSTRTLKDKQEANGRTLALNGSAWRRLRASVLAEQPLCPECRDQGLIVPATDVDHQDNDPTNNDRANLVGLCHAHHSMKTAAEMHGRDAHAKGCDLTGMPRDPDHAWNQGTVAALLKRSPATDACEPAAASRVIANRKD